MSFQKMDLSDRKRPGGRNIVFCHGFSSDQIVKLTEVKHVSGIDELHYVDMEDSKKVIRDLISSTEDTREGVYEESTDCVLLFHGTSQYELQQFITQFRNRFTKRPLIAMVTKTSEEWVFQDLIQELKEERRQIEKR